MDPNKHFRVSATILYFSHLLSVLTHDSSPSSSSSSCSHFYPTRDELTFNVKVTKHTIVKRSISENEIIPLRIRVFYDSSLDTLPSPQKVLIQSRVIPSSVSYWERTLAARKPVRGIHLYRRCITPQIFTQRTGLHYCWKDCASETKCGHTTLPESHLLECRYCDESGIKCGTKGTRGAGFSNTDFVLYVSTVDSDRCKFPNTVAYAAYCQLEFETDRPLAGYVNICPSDKTLSNAAHNYASLLSTVKHEILHALGFSAGLFAFYRDDQGTPLTPRLPDDGKPLYNETSHLYQWSSEIIKSYYKEWKSIKGVFPRKFDYIVTPRVVREVRKHFNCETLEGAELENQGGHGTEFTHLEKRLFGNEAMTGTYTHNPVFSRITLALMEDTGWYVSNYTMAETLTWGRNLGCGFVHDSCMVFGGWSPQDVDDRRDDYRKQRPPQRLPHPQYQPFCSHQKPTDSSDKLTCTQPSRDFVGLCNLIQFTTAIPEEYQYFAHRENLGGSVTLADYCPFVQDFNWKKNGVTLRGSSCKIPENNLSPSADNVNLETYGKDSICLNQFKPWRMLKCEKDAIKTRDFAHWGSGCYKVTCLPVDDGSVEINVVIEIQNHSYQCRFPGEEITVRIMKDDWLHEGSLLCPESCHYICNNRTGGDRMDEDPNWCYKRKNNLVPLRYSIDNLKCKSARASYYLSETVLIIMNLLLIVLFTMIFNV